MYTILVINKNTNRERGIKFPTISSARMHAWAVNGMAHESYGTMRLYTRDGQYHDPAPEPREVRKWIEEDRTPISGKLLWTGREDCGNYVNYRRA